MNDITPAAVQGDNHPALLASVSELKTKLGGSYKEQVYNKQLADLAGVTFEPLAGLKVTFLPTLFPSSTFRAPDNSNLILSANYVEYLTGHQRVLLATIELVGGYVPFNVSAGAFGDALRHSVEHYLNTCGYSMASEVPDGLRQINHVQIGHDRLTKLFDPTRAFRSVFHTPPRGEKENISVSVQDQSIVTTAQAGVLKLLPGMKGRLAHVDVLQNAALLDEYKVVVIARRIITMISIDADLRIEKVILHRGDSQKLPAHLYPSYGGLKSPHRSRTKFHAVELETGRVRTSYAIGDDGHYKLEGDVLTHVMPSTLLREHDEGTMEVLTPDQWRSVRSLCYLEYDSDFPVDVTKSMPTMPTNISAHELEQVFSFIAKNIGDRELVTYYTEPPPVPAPTVVVEETQSSYDTVAKDLLTPPKLETRRARRSLWNRIRMAWRAFFASAPTTKE